MKTRLLVFSLFVFLSLIPNFTNAQLDSCWRLIYPHDPEHGSYNPDSVMLDTCRNLRYAKRKFQFEFTVNAIHLPAYPIDTVIRVSWQAIDSNFIELKQSFDSLYQKYGDYIFVKVFPNDTDLIRGSQVFRIFFNQYVIIDTVIEYLKSIKQIKNVHYIVNYGKDEPGDVLEPGLQTGQPVNLFKIELLINPNPVEDKLLLSTTPLGEYSPIINLTLFTIDGKQIQSMELKSGETIEIESQNLSQGVYFIKAEVANDISGKFSPILKSFVVVK